MEIMTDWSLVTEIGYNFKEEALDENVRVTRY